MAHTTELILHNGKVWSSSGFATALAIRGNKIERVGTDAEILANKAGAAQVIDLRGRTVIPGLNDSHLHLIRGGLNYNLELRWDGINSLADAFALLKRQVDRTPPPQWVRVVGGFSAHQFKEKRLPTLDEINRIAPHTPVFILHLYDRALLNRAALKAVGYDKNTPDPPGATIERDSSGNPTGILIAAPNAMILYSTLAKGPKLSSDDQINSTRQFMRELNRLGITSVIDAGGGFQNYPDDYAVIERLHKENKLTVRIAYNLFTQRPKHEREDFDKWTAMTSPGAGDEFFRMNGAGEMLVYSAADFEDFRQPRPDMPWEMEDELRSVVQLLVRARWPFRLHATYNETIERALNIFEQVDKDISFDGLQWFFDHGETISEANMERVMALGGGIAIQHRMAYQGEYFIERYGAEAASRTPPFKRMLGLGLPVGAGTDATRVAGYNPFVALSWLTTGKTVGNTALYNEDNLLTRERALELYTSGSAWFSSEEAIKGRIQPGYLADVAVLTADYFSCPSGEIPALESVLTILDGQIVYAAQEYSDLGPKPLPVSPDWSPANSEWMPPAQPTPSNVVHRCDDIFHDVSNLLYRPCPCYGF